MEELAILERVNNEQQGLPTRDVNEAIATHGEKMHWQNILVVNHRILVVSYSRIAIKSLQLTTKMIHLCIFSSWAAMAKSQWTVVMHKFSSSDTANHELVATKLAATGDNPFQPTIFAKWWFKSYLIVEMQINYNAPHMNILQKL